MENKNIIIIASVVGAILTYFVTYYAVQEKITQFYSQTLLVNTTTPLMENAISTDATIIGIIPAAIIIVIGVTLYMKIE